MILTPGEVISLCGMALMFIFNIWTVSRATKTDNSKDGKVLGQILTQIGYLQGQLESVSKKLDTQNAAHYALSERVGRVEESAKSAHHRINRIEGVETRDERK